ncbi:MAG TPA: HNH endonuclease [Gemmataceae bacterium]|nr:HNH endonuclease [Gemmataceae bacterium]
MNLLVPFAYPTTPHARRHGPRGYQDYGDYKPFLRDEFTFRCVYCLERELWYPNRDGSFSVDHFTPKAIDPTRETDYENLVYACVRCNSYKQARITLLDPTKVAFAEHFLVNDDGHIVGLTPEARDLINLLDLDHSPALEVWRYTLNVLRLKERYPSDEHVHWLFLATFGYPTDLPDLSRPAPPGGNSRPEGLTNSHFERKKAGSLPEVY